MSGIAFGAKGSAGGPAPVTSFFGAIPDYLSMLMPGHPAQVGPWIFDKHVQARNVNTWTTFNPTYFGGSNTPSTSLGAFTTAPDGTNTAQKLVETTYNGYHYPTAGWTSAGTAGMSLRIACFAKAAERTRFVLLLGEAGNSLIYGGGIAHAAHMLIDLAGAQIVSTTVTGTWNVYNSQVYPVGNGWFMCFFDAVTGSASNNQYVAAVILDNGSGLATESTTYAGDGSSGMYFWNTCVLPPQAWAMSGTEVFRDDFTSLSDIDLTNSKAAGFKWYTNNSWPFYLTSLPAANSSEFSIVTYGGSSSVLQIKNPALNSLSLQTAVSLGGTNYNSSFLMTPPLMYEARQAYDFATAPGGGGAGGAFTQTNWTNPISKYITSDIGLEYDIFESEGGVGGFDHFTFTTADAQQELLVQSDATVGAPNWISTHTYRSINNIVNYNGALYTSLVNSNIGNIPSSSPSQWSGPFSYPSGPTTYANVFTYDSLAFQTYTLLWVPATRTALGALIAFFNGMFTQSMQPYGPTGNYGTENQSSVQQYYDTHQFVLNLGAAYGVNFNNWDWVRIVQ